MSSIQNVFNTVLADIVPKPEELSKINEIVDVITVLLKRKAKELAIEYRVIEPQGSTGIKQTQLRNDFDIDLFIGLSYEHYEPNYKGISRNQFKKVSKQEFLKLCNEWIIPSLTLKEFRNPRLLYAEHPYVTVDFIDKKNQINVKLDIVLYFELSKIYLLKNGPLTSVDRSPWHGRFVRDSLTHDQKNDVRLLKQFFKACHSYGDKSAVGKVGFIGYSAELLIYHYRDLENCFRCFNQLNLTPLDYHGRTKEELNQIVHFQNDYLIITDPVDPNRNVASAISERAYKYVNHRIKEFLKAPNTSFFDITPIEEVNTSILEHFYVIECQSKSLDTHYTINRDKLYALGDSIKSNGEKEFSHDERFEVIEFENYFEHLKNEYNMAIYCKKPIISKTYLRKGPPIKEEEHAKRFREKNPNHFEKNGYLWVETERSHSDFMQFLTDFAPTRISDKLEILKITVARDVNKSSAKRALTVLQDMVLPFI